MTSTDTLKDKKIKEKPADTKNPTTDTIAKLIRRLKTKLKLKHPGAIFEEPETMEDLGSGTVLVLFSANWCGQCAYAGEFLQRQEEQLKKVGIKPYEFYQDLGIQPHKEWSPLADDLMKKHEIESIPTVLIFSSGKLLQKFVGTNYWKKNNIPELPTWIEVNIKNAEAEKK